MVKINAEEYEILKKLIGESFKWICRDEDGDLIVYENKPYKGNVAWWWDINSEIRRISNSNLFQFIQWEDREPYNTQELIDEYLDDEYGYFNMKLSREFEEFIKKRKRGKDMTKINQKEYELLKSLDDKWKWVARNRDGGLYKFQETPEKVDSFRWNDREQTWLGIYGNLFQFIQWEDEEPYNIAELIKEYEWATALRSVLYGESEEVEMKDSEWLKREIRKELEDWHGVEGGIDGDGINEIMLLINQYEESEVKRLERKIKELDSFNDELIRDNNQFRNELDSLNSQVMGLHTSYDEQIKSLEYELFVEKTRDSEHKLYWFTAKKTPPIVDISYLSNETTLYGFKQSPTYNVLKYSDLRFITHSTLDELIEQFR